MIATQLPPRTTGSPVSSKIGRHRWVVCALLFFATTINYLDRMVFGLVGPELQKLYGWSNKDYTDIVFWFEVAYAIGLVSAGRFLDWIGTRKGFSISVIFWSLACMLHAFMSTITGFSIARFLLGLGEAGNFPACVKTIAEWFPKKERAFAAGIMNAGCNVGAIAAPIAVPIIFIYWGWEWTFIITGATGFIWLIFWLTLYHVPNKHPRITQAELDYIHSDPPEPQFKFRLRDLLVHREAWAFISAKFLTDSIWRWYLYLLPLVLCAELSSGHQEVRPAVCDDLSHSGSRKHRRWLALLAPDQKWLDHQCRPQDRDAPLRVVRIPVAFVTQVSNMWVAVLLVGLAAAAHQGWSANLFTTASDMFPKQAVGSLVGLGGMAGALSAMLILKVTGYVLERTGSFTILFIIAGSTYLLALAIFHLLTPRLAPARVSKN